jgi:hypothetical protein
MTTHYFANEYQDPYVREHTPNLTIDQMLKITKTRLLGTIVDPELIRRLNEAFPSLDFAIARDCPMGTLIDQYKNNLPTITICDASYLLTEIPGAHHAGVVVGFINEDYIVLNNPWLGPFKPVDITMFKRSWELEGNQAILINPKKQRRLEDFMDARDSE